MKIRKFFLPALLSGLVLLAACSKEEASPPGPPGADAPAWTELFRADLADAEFPAGVWTFEDGVLTASEDQAIWTAKDHENFVLDLEFKTAPGTNSGVILHCSDVGNWIPNSIEVQIADDFAEEWAKAPATWHCGAIFGHLAPTKSMVKPAGEWNRMTITCSGPLVSVVLNGETVTEMDMRLWTSADSNPDGSEIPSWLSRPVAEIEPQGRIGLQGKHAGAPIFFRNLGSGRSSERRPAGRRLRKKKGPEHRPDGRDRNGRLRENPPGIAAAVSAFGRPFPTWLWAGP
jgi:hypothetical protein